MTQILARREQILSYHAHIYYGVETRRMAEQLREEFIRLSKILGNGEIDIACKVSPLVDVGRMHDTAVGPHPQPMFRLELSYRALNNVVQHLMLRRGSLSVLIHPITNDEVRDHTLSPMWMGTPLTLDLSKL